MRRPVTITAACGAMMLFMASCNTSGCLDNQASIPLAGFYGSSDEKQLSLSSVAIGGVGAPADTLLVDPAETVSSVYLPLRSDRSSTAFFIRYPSEDAGAPEVADTITIEYSSYPYFASEECGAMFRYRINRLTHTSILIDRVVILDSLITNTEAERLHIYFKV